MESGDLLPALLKFWRHKSGLSQLDLSLATDISARHISFIETGRTKPSKEVILTLSNALSIPLREQNHLLRAAGHAEHFEAFSYTHLDASPAGRAIDYMLRKHDPYPMVLMDSCYNLIRGNESAGRIFEIFVAKPDAMQDTVNLLDMIYHPDLCQPFVVDWESSAHKMLTRLYRETLEKSHDQRLQALLQKLTAYPNVPKFWCQPDFSSDCEPTATLTLKRGNWRFAFLMTMTSFSAPQNVTIEELMIESYFPLDDQTEQACHRLIKGE